jgi:hypothetical protein
MRNTGTLAAAALLATAGCALVLGLDHNGMEGDGGTDAGVGMDGGGDVNAEGGPDAPPSRGSSRCTPGDGGSWCSLQTGYVACLDFETPGALGAWTPAGDAFVDCEASVSPPNSLAARAGGGVQGSNISADFGGSPEAGALFVTLNVMLSDSCTLEDGAMLWFASADSLGGGSQRAGFGVSYSLDAGYRLGLGVEDGGGPIVGLGGSAAMPLGMWTTVRLVWCLDQAGASIGDAMPEVGCPGTATPPFPGISFNLGAVSVGWPATCTVHIDNLRVDEK